LNIKYSVIVPTLNEEYYIGKNINAITNKRDDVEIIVADGGSSDGTVEAAAAKGARISNTEKGRGIQLNAGASIAKGNILFFLHADTLIPENTFDLLDDFFPNENNNICRFKLGFDIDNHLLKVYTSFSKFNTIFTRYGDSGIVIRKNFFNSMGGFKNYFIFEDVEFLSRVSKKAKIRLLNAEAKSSARKFVYNGLIKNQIQSFALFAKYFLGSDSSQLWNDYFIKKNKMKKSSLIIFVRYPVKRKVKTRLARDTNDEFSYDFYKICTEEIIKQARGLKSFNKYLFYTGAEEKEKIMSWAGPKFLYALQEGNNLGSRMLNAFELVFSHYAGKAIIIGSDIPDINPDIIYEADKQLDNADIVIGPSEDGGYYLLGMKKVYKELFENIDWSSNSVYNSTVETANKLNLKTIELKMLRDIDTKRDLDEWLNDAAENPLKRTIKSLTQMKS